MLDTAFLSTDPQIMTDTGSTSLKYETTGRREIVIGIKQLSTLWSIYQTRSERTQYRLKIIEV
jgi:hypothetical protein